MIELAPSARPLVAQAFRRRTLGASDRRRGGDWLRLTVVLLDVCFHLNLTRVLRLVQTRLSKVSKASPVASNDTKIASSLTRSVIIGSDGSEKMASSRQSSRV